MTLSAPPRSLGSSASSSPPRQPETPTTPPPRRPRGLVRALATGGLAAGLVLVGVTTADAHVHVHPDSTSSGSFSALTFRVPNESAKAGTVTVAVQLPTTTPFLSVSIRPVPGWTATATEAKLPQPVQSEGTTVTRAVRTVTWTARPGSQIAPGQYQEFAISVGPLPAPGVVLLPVDQTYSDGTVVRWDEPTPSSGEEPEHPAPALAVTAAVAGDDDGDAAPSPSPAAAGTAAASPARSDTPARVLAGAALLVALVAAALAGAGLRRRTTSGSPT